MEDTNVLSTFNLGGVVEAPVAGGFTPSLWIGPITASYIYEASWLAFDLAKGVQDHAAQIGHAAFNDPDPGSETGQTFAEVLGDTPFDAVVFSSRTSKYAYYFTNKDRAEAVCRFLDVVEAARRKDGKTFKHRPTMAWRYQTSVAGCLTLTQKVKEEKFDNDTMVWDSDIKALGSSSPKQHLYHMLQLPAGVHAFAKFAGWDVPDMATIDELSGPSDEVIVTEALRDRLIGGNDIPLRESQAWLDRAALWAALGEDEPEAFGWDADVWKEVTGLDTPPPDDGKAKLTSASKLAQALYALRSNWAAPHWAGVLQVPDPEPANVYESNGKTLNPRIPLLGAFYRDEAAARAAAEESGGAAEKPADLTGLDIPAAYSGDAEMFAEQVRIAVDEKLPGVLGLTVPLRAARVKKFCSSAVGAEYLSDHLMASDAQFTAAVEALVG